MLSSSLLVMHTASGLLSEAKSWRTLCLIEDCINALEEDVSEDGEADASIRLNTTEAGAGRYWCVVDVASRHSECLASDRDTKVRQFSRARDSVATLGAIVAGPLDGAVVGLHIGGGKV